MKKQFSPESPAHVDQDDTHRPGRAMTGFFALLTPEQRAATLAYTGGDDNLGDPELLLQNRPTHLA